MEPLQNPQLDPLLLLMAPVERVPLQRDARLADTALRALEEAEGDRLQAAGNGGTRGRPQLLILPG